MVVMKKAIRTIRLWPFRYDCNRYHDISFSKALLNQSDEDTIDIEKIIQADIDIPNDLECWKAMDW